MPEKAASQKAPLSVVAFLAIAREIQGLEASLYASGDIRLSTWAITELFIEISNLKTFFCLKIDFSMGLKGSS